MEKPVITFIGSGNMASSLIGGLIADQYSPKCIWATDLSLEKLNRLKEGFHINTSQDNKEGAKRADVVVLAVKPDQLKSALLDISVILKDQNPLIISIVTGVRSTTMTKWADNSDLSIVRTMPNTPALLRCATTGLWANSNVTEEQKGIAESILRAVGVTLWVDAEEDLDLVTAVSGSGPAYFFLVMEAMFDCAKGLGLSANKAELLIKNTALGAARMALESGKDVAALRKQVTSPGGTTEQAINVFEKGGIRDLFNQALTAAKNRAVEMSKLIE